ncbi:MAG: PAS domain S-box protein, partial [Ramlibacter sp.]
MKSEKTELAPAPADEAADVTATSPRVERLLAAMNEAADGIQVIDPGTMAYEEVNEAAARIFGLTLPRMFEMGPAAVYAAMGMGSAADVAARFDEVIARQPDAVTGVANVTLPGGALRTLEFSRRAKRAGDRWLIVSVERDVTERAADQRRLKHLYAALNDSDALGVIDAETLTYVDVNEAGAVLAGRSREELMRLGPQGYLREAGEEALAANLSSLYAEVISGHPEAVTEVVRRRRPDGTTAVLHIARRAVQVDGRWVVVGVNRDITERYRATQRLERLVAAMNEAADAILVVDPQAMKYEDVNEAAARFFGLTREQVMEMGPERVSVEVEQAPISSVAASYNEAIGKYPEAIGGMRDVTIGGSVRTVEFTLRAVQADDRWLIVNVGRDVTARVRAERELHLRMEELARSNRDLEQFAYVTSHDLSEPLRMVAGYTQLLSRRYSDQLDRE